MKRKPTGFIAICQCGKVVGALDFIRTDKKDAGRIMGKWLADGCTVRPEFNTEWSCKVEGCLCDKGPVIGKGGKVT